VWRSVRLGRKKIRGTGSSADLKGLKNFSQDSHKVQKKVVGKNFSPKDRQKKPWGGGNSNRRWGTSWGSKGACHCGGENSPGVSGGGA